MRYKSFDQATRNLVVENVERLAEGSETIWGASLTMVVLLSGNDDPRIEEPLTVFVAANSDSDDLHLGVLREAAPAFRAELERRVERFVEHYRETSVAAGQRIVAVFENPELTRRISRILSTAWDPVGIVRLPAGKGFYDEHVPQLRELLRVEATEQEIADHLIRIEDEVLKFPVDRPRALNVARLLIENAAEFRAQPSVNED
ncbi:hypothetical protein FRZ44_31620 [Hypericibacter terrae]|uniref:Uncharacterized protein n=1 Tax=Hypericibacter terrae TaxID=2602015 RepID=A0A5J6MKH9_9PROT|nr:hypothetical protein [Hypericibacter terrae]QEX17859.1 hypothetical protein FRZ44_31620 [Hypericibacter terrae]